MIYIVNYLFYEIKNKSKIKFSKMILEQTVEDFRISLSNENIFLNKIYILNRISLKDILKSSISIISFLDSPAPKAQIVNLICLKVTFTVKNGI